MSGLYGSVAKAESISGIPAVVSTQLRPKSVAADTVEGLRRWPHNTVSATAFITMRRRYAINSYDCLICR